jgi:hypothetical protein
MNVGCLTFRYWPGGVPAPPGFAFFRPLLAGPKSDDGNCQCRHGNNHHPFAVFVGCQFSHLLAP